MNTSIAPATAPTRPIPTNVELILPLKSNQEVSITMVLSQRFCTDIPSEEELNLTRQMLGAIFKGIPVTLEV